LQADARRLGGAHVGAHRDVHADIAGRTGKERADDEGDRGNETKEKVDKDGDDHADDGDRRILPAQIGFSALLNGLGDLDHLGVAGGCGEHALRSDDPVKHGDHPTADGGEHNGHCLVLPLSLRPVISRDGRRPERAPECGGCV
jgi:hypothetical protein